MEKVLLKSDRFIQWKAVFAMALAEIITSVLLSSNTSYPISWRTFLSPVTGFCCMALALYCSTRWIKAGRAQHLTAAVINSFIIIPFSIMILPWEVNALDLGSSCVSLMLSIFVMLEVSRYTNNKLFAYYIPFTTIGWIHLYIATRFIWTRFYPMQDILTFNSILQAFTPLPIAMWLLAVLKVRFVFHRDTREDEVRNQLEASEYLNKPVAFEEIRNTSPLSEKQVVKIFTTVPDPHFKDETKIINIFLSVALLANAFFLLLSKGLREIIASSMNQSTEVIILSFIVLGFFFFKLTLAYFIYVFRPWAYWVVIIMSVIEAALPVYRIYKIRDYLSYYRPDLDSNQLWLILGSIVLHLVLAVIAIRILRKLFSSYRPFYLKKNKEGKYEL